jgi:predicted RNase H-like nuclease (RuvC/YqgF family)
LQSFIAGIDAGATSAYAIMTLDGEVLEVKSRKDAKGDFLFESLAKYSPLFIACDTSPPSQAARKLKRSFCARLFHPSKSLSLIEKELLCKSHKTRNAHERDALASAIKCQHALSSKLRQLKRRLSERGAQDSYEVIARGMLFGRRVSDLL